MIRHFVPVVVILGLVLPYAAVVSAADKVEKEETTLLLEDVEGSKTRRGIIRGLVKAPPERVWAVITDYEHFEEFMPKVSESTEITRTETSVHYSSKVNMPWPIANVSYECQVAFKPDHRSLEFHMVPGTGKGVKSFEGGWVLDTIEDRPDVTMAQYTLFFEADRWYPKWAVEIGTKSTLGKILEAVRKRVRLQAEQSGVEKTEAKKVEEKKLEKEKP